MRFFRKKQRVQRTEVVITISDEAKQFLDHFNLSPEEERKKLLVKYSSAELLFLDYAAGGPKGLSGVPRIVFEDKEHEQTLLNLIFGDKKEKLVMAKPYVPGKIVGTINQDDTITRVSSDGK